MAQPCHINAAAPEPRSTCGQCTFCRKHGELPKTDQACSRKTGLTKTHASRLNTGFKPVNLNLEPRYIDAIDLNGYPALQAFDMQLGCKSKGWATAPEPQAASYLARASSAVTHYSRGTLVAVEWSKPN